LQGRNTCQGIPSLSPYNHNFSILKPRSFFVFKNYCFS